MGIRKCKLRNSRSKANHVVNETAHGHDSQRYRTPLGVCVRTRRKDQARYVLTATPARAMAILAAGMEQNIQLSVVGEVTAGATVKIGATDAISMANLRSAHESWFPAFMKS